ncbi:MULTISPECIES: wax ester/triacylglycerol synthase domain-containing protein [Streptomyces]|uniref:diacylglycerol O-acyltransferase n=2 Tax=Streptomyces TaxID=1883 RepID=A0ABW7SY72_9ACTN
MSRCVPLSLADEFVARHTCGPLIWCVVFLLRGRPPGAEELRRRVAARWAHLPRMRWVLMPSPGAPAAGRRRWTERSAFVAEHHVLRDPTGRTLEAWASGALTHPLPPDRPLWQLRLMPCPTEGGYGLLLRMHHALADGQSAITLMRLLLDGPGDARPAPARRPERSDPRRVAESYLRAGLAVPLPPGRGVEPALAWSPVDADMFRAARRALPDGTATTTETLMAAAAGSLRGCFGDPAGWPGRGRVFTWVPVSLRTAENADELGNMASALRLPLPVDGDTPVARLSACRGLVDAFGRRALDLPWRLARLVRLMGPRAMDAVLARAMRPSHAAVSCTSLPWGRTPWALDGDPVARVVASSVVPPVGCCHFVLSNYADTPVVAVTTHRLPGDARRLAAAFAREVARLAECGAA